LLDEADRTLAPLLSRDRVPPPPPPATGAPPPPQQQPRSAAQPPLGATIGDHLRRLSLIAVARADEPDGSRAGVHPPPAQREDVHVLAFDVAQAQWRAAPPGTPSRAAAERKAVERLEAALATALPPPALMHLAGAARELGRIDLAISTHERLAALVPGRCAEWLVEAAREHLAQGAPARAADSYARAYACEPEARAARTLGRQAVDAYLAADQAPAALKLIERLVERYASDEELLRQGERIAIAQDDPPGARRFGARLVALGISDPTLLQRQVDLAVAAGDRGGAVAAAQRLSELEGERVASHVRLAELAGWAGQPRLALREWLWLARRGEPREAAARALQLARDLGDRSATIELLERKSESGPLPAASLQELADAVEGAEGSARMLEVLRLQARHHPDDRVAWEQLVAAHERQRDLKGALDTRREVSRHFGPSIDGSLRIAALEWELGRPAEALRELAQWSSSTQVDADYWKLLADLAWERELDDDLALRAYRKLWEQGRIDALGAERLVLLTRAAGRHDEVIRLGAEAFTRTPQPRLLLLAMDEAANAKNWAVLRELSDRASGSEPAFATLPAYWLLRGRLEEHEQRTADAAASYRRALAVDPGSSAARAALIWLYGGAHDRAGLTGSLEAWAGDAWNDRMLRPAYAAALDELGRRGEALAFHERDARADPTDAARVKRYADALERSGDRPAADEVKRRLASLNASSGSGSGAVALAPGDGGLRALSDLPAPVRARENAARLAAVRAEASTETIGPLSTPSARVTVDSEALGSALQLRAGLTSLNWAPFPWGIRETDLRLRATIPGIGGQNEFAVGGNIREAQSLPTAAVAHSRQLAPYTQGRLEAAWNEPADESAVMRMEAVRTRVGGTVTVADRVAYARLDASWRSWSSRTGQYIGSGGLGSAELGCRVFASRPDLRVRVQASHQRNSVVANPLSIDFPIVGVVTQ
ncbi:MAG TPA: tetratricopeptide repeat protein, partial [Anaeromyxobacteraceae bacterium]